MQRYDFLLNFANISELFYSTSPFLFLTVDTLCILLFISFTPLYRFVYDCRSAVGLLSEFHYSFTTPSLNLRPADCFYNNVWKTMEKYSFIDSYPKNLFSLLHIFLCGLMPSIPSRPCTPPLLLGEAGEMNISTTISKNHSNIFLFIISFLYNSSLLIISIPTLANTEKDRLTVC